MHIQAQAQGRKNAGQHIQAYSRLAVLDAVDRADADVCDHGEGPLVHALTAALLADT
jgi:hypothetical protein